MALAKLDLSPVKFLLIEDSGFMRKVLREIMYVMNSHNLVLCSNGEEALEVLETYQPDIIITDWEMSPINGIEFTRTIRARTDTPHEMIAVVMLSSHTEASRVAEARDAGVNEFLAKPISAKVLYARFVALVQSTRPFVRSNEYTGPCRRRHNSENYIGQERRNDHGSGD